jgi:hypothetical protein
MGDTRTIDPTREEVDAIVAEVKRGVGYERACAIHGVPARRAARWLRDGRAAMSGSHADRHSEYARLARGVLRERARLVGRMEANIAEAIESEDERRRDVATMWALPRYAPRDYAEATRTVAEQRIAEDLLERVLERMSPGAQRELLEALRAEGVEADQ